MQNHTSLSRTVEPSQLPVTRAEVKQHLRNSDTVEDDELIDSRIASATEYVERILGRALCEQTWEMKLCAFPTGQTDGDRIELPRVPVVSITSVTYLDTTGASQTLSPSTYYLVADRDSAALVRAYGQTWPATLPQENAVTVTWVAGYPKGGVTPDWDYRKNVPPLIKEAVALLVQGSFDELKPDDMEALEAFVWAKLSTFHRRRI